MKESGPPHMSLRPRLPPPDLRLTRLDHLLRARRVVHARELADDISREAAHAPLYDAPRLVATMASAGFATAARRMYEHSDTTLVASHAKANLALIRLFVSLHKKYPESDYREFAERVFDAFHQAHMPYESVNHPNLNALARAAFVLDKTETGIHAMHAILSNGISPDLRDLNVILTEIAKRTPRSAGPWLNKMRQMGFVPDEVSFASILRITFKKQEWKAKAKAQASTESFLTNENENAANAHLTYVLSPSSSPPSLETLKSILEYLPKLDPAHPARSIASGRRIVYTCLERDPPEPTLAYQAWKLCLEGKAEASSDAHIALRVKIMTALGKEVRARRLRRKIARKMRSALDSENSSTVSGEEGEQQQKEELEQQKDLPEFQHSTVPSSTFDGQTPPPRT